MAAMSTWWALALFLYGSLSLSEPVPVDSDTSKDFLATFEQWIESAQAQELVDEGKLYTGDFKVDASWPETKVKLGQVGGVATNVQGDAVVFHRAGRSWEEGSFKDKVYNKKDDGAIMEPTVLTMNRSNGAVLDTWGQNLFYLPHGLTIDHEGNHWVTDVALHQVFKFGKNKAVPEMTLGKAFEPALNNDDLERFCKPTDVAVAKNGDFFVSDGYCNSRVVKYAKDGTLLGVMGQDDMWVPHSLALVEDMDIICVADREDKRILCYDAGLKDASKLGFPVGEYKNENIMGRVFAITYSDKDELLYAVSAPTETLPGSGFSIDLYNKQVEVIAVWTPSEEGFDMPHDLDVTLDGATVYVGEIGPNKIWKFGKD